MSKKEAPVGLTIMEKLIGMVIIAIGAITFYVTYTGFGGVYTDSVFFLGGGLALIVIGVLLLIAKSE